MKVLRIVALAGILLVLPAVSRSSPLGAMRTSLIDGDVQVRIPEAMDWAPAAINMPVAPGDELWVPDDARAELHLSNGARIRLGGGTAFQVVRAEQDSFQFFLTEGRAYVHFRAPKGSVIQVDTPSSSVRAKRPSAFRIDVPDGDTDIAVFQGSVVAESGDGETRISSGDSLRLGQDGYAELSPLGPPDEWDEWNMRRDRKTLARRESDRYLPAELRTYAPDFDENGRWVRDDEYGNVWMPTVVIASDWAPYRHGRWVYRGGDYVWIGYEPWGWAPYHYGRWTFLTGRGWCWVPPGRGEVYWGPGYVGWVRTEDYVSWVPLAPRETYYGHGYYGPHSVNVTTINVTEVRITNVYRNVNVVNGITVVHRDTFLTGRPVAVRQADVARVREDRFLRRNVEIGRPRIQPAERSYVPVVRAIPEAKRPPASVRSVRVEELRRTRPLVREAGRSAIAPGARPRPLEVRRVDTPRERPGRETGGRPGRQPDGAGIRGPDRGVPPATPPPRERGRTETLPAPRDGRGEREVGRPPVAPREKERPATSPGGPASQDERGGKPAASPSVEKGRPERPSPGSGRPTERIIRQTVPAPPMKTTPQPGPPSPGGPGDKAIERPRTAPPERGRPETAPGGPAVRDERGGKPAAAPSVEKGRPESRPISPEGRVERGGKKEDRPAAVTEEKKGNDASGRPQEDERPRKNRGPRQQPETR